MDELLMGRGETFRQSNIGETVLETGVSGFIRTSLQVSDSEDHCS